VSEIAGHQMVFCNVLNIAFFVRQASFFPHAPTRSWIGTALRRCRVDLLNACEIGTKNIGVLLVVWFSNKLSGWGAAIVAKSLHSILWLFEVYHPFKSRYRCISTQRISG